ncbi:guanylate cyclase [Trichonephila clavipes]|nr:guanylate cyclase [Trichonephila clavipes]
MKTGWYIAEYTVKYFWESNNTVIDHWRAFTLPEVVKYFELSKEELLSITFGNKYCLHKECGEDGVYRPKICQKPDAQCATLLADYPASNFETLKNEITDLKLLVNVAWIGDQLEAVVEKRTLDRKYTLFFHRMPMALSSIEKFTHVSFPNCEDVPYSSCEFEINQLKKIVWSKIKSNAPHAFYVLKALSFDQSDYLKLLKRYMLGKTRGFNEEDIACHWMRENIYVWDKWIPVDNKNKTKLYIGGIFPINGIYWKQSGVITGKNLIPLPISNQLQKEDRDSLLCRLDKIFKSNGIVKQKAELWFLQDGATCPTARATINLLKDTFGDRLISRFGPVNWPSRSCDLTPLAYFLWGYVKSLVYADKPKTLDHLEDNIRRVIADIRPQMLEKVIENWTSRLDYIRASRGSHMPEIIFKM